MSNSTTERENQYEVIPEVVSLIVEKVGPKMVILFGSCAKGIITIHSDIDLCVVVKEELKPKERANLRSKLLMAILEITDFEIDIFICSEEVWRQNHKDQGTFVGKIYKEGKILYGG